MADIELVIKIPEEKYDVIKSDLYNTFPVEMREWGLEAIKNGTVLPKMHGDLVDRDEINSRFNAIYDELASLSCQPTYKELLDKLSMCLDTAEPVIRENYEEIDEEIWK